MKMNPNVNEDMDGFLEANFYEDDDVIYEDDFDLELAVSQMISKREEMSFDDFVAKINPLTGAKRAKGNAKYLMTFQQVQDLKAQMGGGNAVNFYSIRETISGEWVVGCGISIADGTIGHMASATFLDVDKDYYVEYSA